MGWFKAIKSTMNALARQVKLDFCDLWILAVERIKHEDAFYCPDHSRAFEKQKLEHIYKMLKAQRVAELASSHEPDEIRESMMLYDENLRKIAEIIANDMFLTVSSNAIDRRMIDALKKNQEEDPVIESKERVLQTPYLMADFVWRIFMYGFNGLVFGLVGLKLCFG